MKRPIYITDMLMEAVAMSLTGIIIMAAIVVGLVAMGVK